MRVSRDEGPLMSEYLRTISRSWDEYQLSRAGGMVGSCIIEPVLQVCIQFIVYPTPYTQTTFSYTL